MAMAEVDATDIALHYPKCAMRDYIVPHAHSLDICAYQRGQTLNSFTHMVFLGPKQQMRRDGGPRF